MGARISRRTARGAQLRGGLELLTAGEQRVAAERDDGKRIAFGTHRGDAMSDFETVNQPAVRDRFAGYYLCARQARLASPATIRSIDRMTMPTNGETTRQ